MKIIRIAVTILSLVPTLLSAGEIVSGEACYRFSDQDSIQAARDIALSMAKREALEGYSVFVESTSAVENFTLKNDLISSLSVAVLRKMKITETQDLANRKICTEISAEIEPFEIKQRVTAAINRFRRQSMNIPTGLPETKWGKVLKAEEQKEALRVVVECKTRNDSLLGSRVRVIHYDTDGIPDQQDEMSLRSCCENRWCKSKGDILVYNLALPTNKNFTYSFELVE